MVYTFFWVVMSWPLTCDEAQQLSFKMGILATFPLSHIFFPFLRQLLVYGDTVDYWKWIYVWFVKLSEMTCQWNSSQDHNSTSQSMLVYIYDLFFIVVFFSLYSAHILWYLQKNKNNVKNMLFLSFCIWLLPPDFNEEMWMQDMCTDSSQQSIF